MQIVAKETGNKVCRKCGAEKPLDEFTVFKRNKDGRHSYCRPCHNSYNRDRKNTQNWRMKTLYGIDLNEYNRMYAEQEGVCAICEQHEAIEGRALTVDHCHETGTVRGLLCFNCNTSIGKLGDNIEGLKKALKYLEDNI
jgi:hypothetical protein